MLSTSVVVGNTSKYIQALQSTTYFGPHCRFGTIEGEITDWQAFSFDEALEGHHCSMQLFAFAADAVKLFLWKDVKPACVYWFHEDWMRDFEFFLLGLFLRGLIYSISAIRVKVL